MSHGFVAHLTAALLALHTVLGCCWHHAHGGTADCASTQSTVSVDSCECDHAHGDGTAPDSHQQGHHGQHVCQGGTCVFVSSTKVEPAKADCQLQATSVACVPGSSPAVGDAADVQAFYPLDVLLPPLRLHLICQVLLI